MQEKWNQFVYNLCEAKKKDVDEDTFHNLIENQLQLLGWVMYKGEICHKPNIPIGNSKFIQPDILIKNDGEDQFVIEVKRPVHTQTERECVQLESYMRQLKLDVGIYIGEHIEVFYDKPKSKDAVSVMKVPLEINNKLGARFVERFDKEHFSRDTIVDFCEERIQEMQRQANLNKIREGLIADAQTQIAESLTPYLLEKYGSSFSEEEIKGMLAAMHFTASSADGTTPAAKVVVTKTAPAPKAQLVPCVLTRNADARGLFNVEGHTLTVLKGSRINPVHLDNISPAGRKKRDILFGKYTELKDGERTVKDDVCFDSPSGAAQFCVGGSSNGWLEWKDEEGKELKAYRRSGDSKVASSDETVVRSKKIVDSHQIQMDFWTRFRDKLQATKKIESSQAPRPQYWYDIRLGRAHIFLSNICNTQKNFVGVRLYIRNVVVDKYYPALLARKAEINQALGCEPVWDATPAARDKTIALNFQTDLSDPVKTEEALDWMVKETLIFHDVFSREVKGI